MYRWFLYFLIYSFLGYCLEKLFAYAVHSDRQVRKCFLLLPLCPVYGLAMTVVVALSPATDSFLLLAAVGGAGALIAKCIKSAEVIAFEDMKACGTMAAAKAKGLVRSEGKEYVMKDGDIVNFLFNV